MYTIYEIPGVKIGCDAKWPLRAYEQNVDPNDCVILQQESDLIQVSIDELWWQIEKDYPIDKDPYFEMVRRNKLRSPKGGRESGKHKGRYNPLLHMPKEKRFAISSKVGKANVISGHLQSIASSGGKSGGKAWINKDGVNKRASDSNINDYLKDGWVRGRIVTPKRKPNVNNKNT
jgi:hypothetical protein